MTYADRMRCLARCYKYIERVFLPDDGTIPKEIMIDGLHPGPGGYRLWAEAVNDDLRGLLQ